MVGNGNEKQFSHLSQQCKHEWEKRLDNLVGHWKCNCNPYILTSCSIVHFPISQFLYIFLFPFLFTILSLYLFLNEAFKAKGNDYNLLFTPNNGYGDCFFSSLLNECSFFPSCGCECMSRACCKWLAVNQWSNLFTQCFSQSKQIFVHCAHEILNWLWYKKGNPMRIKIATWYRGTAHHEQWYVLVSVCDQNLFHSAKLNRGNYRCEHSMSHLRCLPLSMRSGALENPALPYVSILAVTP